MDDLTRRMWHRVRRFRQWVYAVGLAYRERGVYGILGVFRGMVSLMGTGLVSGSEWRIRMRVCLGCPVYDRVRGRCRPYEGSVLGCGCYMPVKARFRDAGCWLDEVDRGGPYGWGEDR